MVWSRGLKHDYLVVKQADSEEPMLDDSEDVSGIVVTACDWELVAKERRRSLRAIVAAVVIGLVVLALIVVAAILFSSTEAKALPVTRPRSLISFEDILERKYSPTPFNGSWVSDNEVLYRDPDGAVLLYNAETRQRQVILEKSDLIPGNAFEFELSADKTFLLIAHGYSKVFRHSFLARYDIINLINKTAYHLVTGDKTRDPKTHQLATWSTSGNGFVYINNNNIYYRPTASAVVEYKLTETGLPGTVYHGIPDWVYEEEVLSGNKALWFSSDGKKLAFASFNDSQTRVMNIPYYGPPNNPEFQYTHNVPLRYPKPGTPNPIASLSVIDLDEVQTGVVRSYDIPTPSDLVNSEPILAAVRWASVNEIAAVWMNRVQNKAKVTICSWAQSLCNTVLALEESSGWIDLFTPPLFSVDGTQMVLIQPQEAGNSGPFRHVSIVNTTKPDSSVKFLTAGRFVVSEILTWDLKDKKIYFLATTEGDPSQMHLYTVPDSVDNAPHTPKCITCNIKNASVNTTCSSSNVDFSKRSSYYALSCNGPDIPSVNIFNKGNQLIVEWENNSKIRSLLEDKLLPKIKRMEVNVAGGLKAQVQLLLPPHMDDSGVTKYPLLVNVYGGPDSYQVTSNFKVDWSTYLTTNKSIVHAVIDGRGSGLKGNKMLFAGYRHLGTVEIEDQIAVTRYLQTHLNFIDADRTGIWGWSYGGYSTGMALANDTDGVFKCGISVAPVSDWLYYDTIYTERYMGLPTTDDNVRGYIDASLNNKIENFKQKMFLLVHGTLDDNVHYQQSMMLAKALELEDIIFNQQTYPDEEHGLMGVRPHLYHTLGQFLDKCFDFC